MAGRKGISLLYDPRVKGFSRMEKRELDRLIDYNRNKRDISEGKKPILWEKGDVISDVLEITGFLGQGGLGRVFRLYHKQWGLDLAAKVPLLSEYDDILYQNVVREAQTWIHLGIHPNVASCYFVKKFNGIPVIFMDYVDDGSLSDYISSGRLYQSGKEQALRRILDIAIQFAWGLYHAHLHRVVHKDVKPGNVLLSKDGSVKVTDFGISAITGEYTLYSGAFALSAAYCSPEQASLEERRLEGNLSGETAEISLQSDMWGWALSVLEMFVGERTWSVGQAAGYVLHDYLNSKDRREHIPEMPEALAAILKRCFMMRPEDRFADMRELSLSLMMIYGRITGSEYPRKEPEAVDYISDSLNNRASSQMEIGNVREAMQLWEEALQIDANHPESLYNYNMLRWRAGIITDQQAMDQVKKAVPQNSSLLKKMYFEKRDFRTRPISEDTGKAADCWRFFMNYSGYAGYVNGLFANLQKNRLASTAEDGLILLWNLNEGTLIHRMDDTAGVIRCSCADPGLERVFVGIGSSIYAMYPETGRRGRIFHGHRGDINAVLFKDNRLVSAGEDRTIRYWDPGTGILIKSIELDESPVSLCIFEEESLSAGFADGTIRVFNRDREIYRMKAHKPGPVVLSEKNRFLLSGGREGIIKLWNLQEEAFFVSLPGIRTVYCLSASAVNTRFPADATGP